MTRYRVLVVDDSAFMRKMVADMISGHPQFEVVATARNGREAVEKTVALQPDVITMDVEMPEMNGLEALRQIMLKRPTPVIMLSSLTQAGARETLNALEWGAVDFVPKPSGSISLDIHKVKDQLHEKLRIAVETRKSRFLHGRFAPSPPPPAVGFAGESGRPPNTPFAGAGSFTFRKIVAIGTSTGGPRALQQVLGGLPEGFNAPILIVQHMPPQFTKSLAQRLDSLCRIRVVEAVDRCPLQTGTAYIAPGGWHMKLEQREKGGYRVILTRDEPRSGHRPSVDVLFESLVPYSELKRIAVLMTGMGSDGAKGMLALYRAGVDSTIAEAEESCVVFGMPKSAIQLHCVKYVLPLHLIPKKLCELVQT